MATKIPKDFVVTDDHRDYARRKGYPAPEVFFIDFRSHFLAKGTRYADWGLAFKNWMRRQSPSGPFYNAKEWERLHGLSRARKPELPKRPKSTPAALDLDPWASLNRYGANK